MSLYYVTLTVLGIAFLCAIILPRVLPDRAISFPMLYVVFGIIVFALPLGLNDPDPLTSPKLAEKLTELVVIVALTGAGLKLDRPFDLTKWAATWRLLAITMPITVCATALLGHWIVGFAVPTAVLLGAVIAPTDPVVAADVQVGPPKEGVEDEASPEEQEDEIRFALTSEAGLNDGLAFPFTYAALAILTAQSLTATNWEQWLLVDIGYRICIGVIVGVLVGYAFAYLIFAIPSITDLAQAMSGADALAMTLVAYGASELIQGYGFIAVFVAAIVLRHYEWDHEYNRHLHDFIEVIERLLMTVVMVLFGGALVGGLLAPLTFETILTGLILIFIVRPLTGVLGLLGFGASWPERLVISSFGIRGIGSFYYLSYALARGTFPRSEMLWAIVGFVVLTSIVIHGSTAPPVMTIVDHWRDHYSEENLILGLW